MVGFARLNRGCGETIGKIWKREPCKHWRRQLAMIDSIWNWCCFLWESILRKCETHSSIARQERSHWTCRSAKVGRSLIIPRFQDHESQSCSIMQLPKHWRLQHDTWKPLRAFNCSNCGLCFKPQGWLLCLTSSGVALWTEHFLGQTFASSFSSRFQRGQLSLWRAHGVQWGPGSKLIKRCGHPNRDWVDLRWHWLGRRCSDSGACQSQPHQCDTLRAENNENRTQSLRVPNNA